MKSAPDYATQSAAQQLAARITAYWHAAGYPAVRVWLSPYNERPLQTSWAVRSNLISGVPPVKDD